MICVALATEDALSEAVGRRLLAETSPELCTGAWLIRQRGSGYLYKKMRNWCELAKNQPVVLLTDLDQKPCAPALVGHWVSTHRVPEDLLLRVAVREVEAWLLADHEGMLGLLGKAARLPPNPDTLPDPKSHLLRLAVSAPREIRADLLPERGAVARQGIGYDTRLCAFVAKGWSIERAAQRSDSLRRARARIGELAKRLSEKRER